MSNKTFLHIWFPLSWILTAAIAMAVVRLLKEPVYHLGSRLGAPMLRFLKVMFPAGIILPIFAAFLSVCYFQTACNRFDTSAEVIADPDMLHRVALDEMASIFYSLPYVLFVWAAIYAVLLIAWWKTRPSA